MLKDIIINLFFKSKNFLHLIIEQDWTLKKLRRFILIIYLKNILHAEKTLFD